MNLTPFLVESASGDWAGTEKVSGTIFDRLGAGARFWLGRECSVLRVR
jgi:hypothetical protein